MNADERRRRARLPLAPTILSIALASACSQATSEPPQAPVAARAQPSASCPATTGLDVDGDGLADEEETALAQRFAPIVILDPADRNRPASIPWLFERAARPTSGATSFRVPRSARGGSSRPEDWRVYVHVYPSASEPCGVHLQYWFFYPYNTGPLVFDHDSDWEHITVTLDGERAPKHVYLAQHRDDHPGVLRSWASMKKVGQHPVVLSARGTHATYADARRLPFFERAFSCDDLEHCAAPVWKTWLGGGIANVGERSRPLLDERALIYAGRWGKDGLLPGTAAPFGPLHHRGFCVDAFAECRSAIATSR